MRYSKLTFLCSAVFLLLLSGGCKNTKRFITCFSFYISNDTEYLLKVKTNMTPVGMPIRFRESLLAPGEDFTALEVVDYSERKDFYLEELCSGIDNSWVYVYIHNPTNDSLVCRWTYKDKDKDGRQLFDMEQADFFLNTDKDGRNVGASYRFHIMYGDFLNYKDEK